MIGLFARCRRADDEPVIRTLGAEIGFGNARRLARKNTAVLLLHVGITLQRIALAARRFRHRGEHGDEAASAARDRLSGSRRGGGRRGSRREGIIGGSGRDFLCNDNRFFGNRCRWRFDAASCFR